MVLNTEQLYELIGNERKTYKQLQPYLKAIDINVSDRAWRKFVRRYNNEYEGKETYIASNNKGYLLTTKKEDIKSSAIKNIKLGASLIRNAKRDLEELASKNQLSLSEEESSVYDLMLKTGL